ncbi:MAG: polymer-forming cytoskeletal protein [Oscillospiraceae bacterium]
MASNKDNMKQAMRELLSKVGIGEEQENRRSEWEEEQEAPSMENEEMTGSGETEKKFADGMIRKPWAESATESYAASSAPFAPVHTPTPMKGTVISVGTSIFGDIRAEGDVEIQGKLKGNLEASGNVRIAGKVMGDIRGTSVELAACTVQGNITATAALRINAETIVVGDLSADSLTTDGKVKGNVVVEKTAVFQKNAVLLGNVSASLVTMSEGAKVQGTVRISEDNDTSALFGENLDI